MPANRPDNVVSLSAAEPSADSVLDAVFSALSDPVRRSILDRLGAEAVTVTELAAPFDISLQAVSRHIQVLVRAGLVRQERSGRIARCSIDVGPILAAAVWINRYSRYWQSQFDTLATLLDGIDRGRARPKGRIKPGTPLKRRR